MCSKTSITLWHCYFCTWQFFPLSDAMVLWDGEISSSAMLGPRVCSKKTHRSLRWLSFTDSQSMFTQSENSDTLVPKLFHSQVSLPLFLDVKCVPWPLSVLPKCYLFLSSWLLCPCFYVSFSKYCWTISQYFIDWIRTYNHCSIGVIDYFVLNLDFRVRNRCESSECGSIGKIVQIVKSGWTRCGWANGVAMLSKYMI